MQDPTDVGPLRDEMRHDNRDMHTPIELALRRVEQPLETLEHVILLPSDPTAGDQD